MLYKGYILEASPLPKYPATSLQPVDGYNRPLTVALDHQSKEEIEINGTDPAIRYRSSFPRYPFLLMLDSIVSITLLKHQVLLTSSSSTPATSEL